MTKSRAGGWIAGTAFVSILLLVAAWFVLISPTLATAAETQEQAQSQRDQNMVTQVRIAALKKQFENIDALRADLAALQLQVPTTADLAQYRRQVDAVAVARSVTVTALQFGVPVPVEVPAVPEPEPEPEGGTEAAADDTEVVKAAPVVSTFAVSLTINAVGTYDNVLAFLQDLQTGTQRLFLVEQVNGSAATPAEAGAGKPALNQGDLDVIVMGSLYVLPPNAATAPPTTDEPVAPAPLQPANGRNPLLPLG